MVGYFWNMPNPVWSGWGPDGNMTHKCRGSRGLEPFYGRAGCQQVAAVGPKCMVGDGTMPAAFDAPTAPTRAGPWRIQPDEGINCNHPSNAVNSNSEHTAFKPHKAYTFIFIHLKFWAAYTAKDCKWKQCRGNVQPNITWPPISQTKIILIKNPTKIPLLLALLGQQNNHFAGRRRRSWRTGDPGNGRNLMSATFHTPQ